jgi:membrane protease YdiL (CAAX protease family)
MPVALAMVAGTRVSGLRDLYRPAAASCTLLSILHEALVRVPFATALPEELIFRGGLYGLASRKGEFRAIQLTSLLFGLYHIAPTLRRIRAGLRLGQTGHVPLAARLLANVTITALAGLGLAYLRCRTGSVLAPWLVHTTANAAGLLAGWLWLSPAGE